MIRAVGVSLLLFATSLQAADVTFGRLFLTPAQRAALEEARRKNIRADELAAAKASKPKRPPVRDVVVSGVVKRSDGESTVWVNGQPVDGTSDAGLKVRVTSGRAGVIIYDPDKGRTLRLKVGQSADITTGRVRESYEPRAGAAENAASAAQSQTATSPPTAPAAGESSAAEPSQKNPADGPPTGEEVEDVRG